MDRDPVYSPSPNNLQEIETRRGETILSIFPKLVDSEGTGDKFQAVEMVRVWMGEDEIVEGCDLFLPEHWGHHVSPHIEAVIIKPASIDQHPLSPGKLDQDTVPLSNVDNGDPQPISQVSLGIPVGYVSCNYDEQEDRDGHKAFYPPHVGQIEDEEAE